MCQGSPKHNAKGSEPASGGKLKLSHQDSYWMIFTVSSEWFVDFVSSQHQSDTLAGMSAQHTPDGHTYPAACPRALAMVAMRLTVH
jgi:hypothetical protein